MTNTNKLSAETYTVLICKKLHKFHNSFLVDLLQQYVGVLPVLRSSDESFLDNSPVNTVL